MPNSLLIKPDTGVDSAIATLEQRGNGETGEWRFCKEHKASLHTVFGPVFC
jgi:hypothetical protein